MCEIPLRTKMSYLLDKANMVYKFAMLYNDYMSEKRDYGTGLHINMVEVHTLTSIEENPGITITRLAEICRRTKGAVSQTATKLEEKKLIVRKKRKGNARNVFLYVTKEGLELSLAHKRYDEGNVTETLRELKKSCTDQEIESFFKVISLYIELFSSF